MRSEKKSNWMGPDSDPDHFQISFIDPPPNKKISPPFGLKKGPKFFYWSRLIRVLFRLKVANFLKKL